LAVCHIESECSQLSLFSLCSTISLLWTRLWGAFGHQAGHQNCHATDKSSLSDERGFGGSLVGTSSVSECPSLVVSPGILEPVGMLVSSAKPSLRKAEGFAHEEEALFCKADSGGNEAGRGGCAGDGADPEGGISEQTFYRWKAKYGGMTPSDAQKLKGMEDENRRLKKLLAEAMLDNAALKDILGKNV